MRKTRFTLCSIFTFVGVIGFFEVKKAEAVQVFISWDDKAPYSMVDSQLRNTNVFSHPNVGPNKPPMLGSNTAILDIVDRIGVTPLSWTGKGFDPQW